MSKFKPGDMVTDSRTGRAGAFVGYEKRAGERLVVLFVDPLRWEVPIDCAKAAKKELPPTVPAVPVASSPKKPVTKKRSDDDMELTPGEMAGARIGIHLDQHNWEAVKEIYRAFRAAGHPRRRGIPN